MSNTPSHATNLTPLDGRGEEGAPSAIGPRYLYYRPYQEDGAIESRSPAHSNDRFGGRILSKAVTPPHTAASLISHLCKIEGYSGSKSAYLYASLQSQTVLEASARLALMSRSGPGSSEKEPMVLLIKNAERRSPGGPEPSAGLPKNSANYVHYRVYNKEGETASKISFHEGDPTLGRINTLSVAPPFNVASLRACLARAEGVVAKHLQLFKGLSSDSPLSDKDNIALLTDQYPGITTDEPMAFVCLDSAQLPTSEPTKVEMQVKFKALISYGASMDIHQFLGTVEDTQQGIAPLKWERFLKLMREMGFEYDPTTGPSVRFDPPNKNDKPITFHKPHPDPTIQPIMLKNFAKRLRRQYGRTEQDSVWLPIHKGEILLSDGVEISKDFRGHTYDGYMATNSAGKQGFVLSDTVEKC